MLGPLELPAISACSWRSGVRSHEQNTGAAAAAASELASCIRPELAAHGEACSYCSALAPYWLLTPTPCHTGRANTRQGGTWAVHRLEAELLLLDVKVEHVLLVVRCVTTLPPQVKVEDVGRHHLVVLVLPVLLLYELRAAACLSPCSCIGAAALQLRLLQELISTSQVWGRSGRSGVTTSSYSYSQYFSFVKCAQTLSIRVWWLQLCPGDKQWCTGESMGVTGSARVLSSPRKQSLLPSACSAKERAAQCMVDASLPGYPLSPG